MGLFVSVFAGLVAALLAPFLCRPGRPGAGRLFALLPTLIGAYLAGLFVRMPSASPFHASIPWVSGLDVHVAFRLDGLSLLFALLVCLVGALVFLYSSAYMKDHRDVGRFFGFMSAFMAAMLGLVLADNVITLYVFFELTSLTSFLLIGLEHTSAEARRAARQALIVTNAGGLALLAAALLLGQVTGSYTLSEMLAAGTEVRDSGFYGPVLGLILLAAFTKSAQFPFHFWLPNAMEAPTPVSAYLHSAAMVKAGIYLLARFSPVLAGTAAWEAVAVGIGAVTMLAAAWLALRYTDLKQVLAYSTIMALGMMVMLLGIGTEQAVKACLVYVVVHACYKAALFMVVGVIDHETGLRDAHRLGGLGRALPMTFLAAVLAGLSMAGLPPFLGFIGKELVYKSVLEHALFPGLLPAVAVLANVALFAVAGLVSLRPFLGDVPERPRTPHRASPSLWLGPAVLGGIGLLIGVAPDLVDTALLAPAVATTLQAPATVEVRLWHGVTPELGLSLVTFLAGAGVYLAWGSLHGTGSMRRFAAVLGAGPDRAFEAGVRGVTRFAAGTVRLLQSGLLRRYLSLILVAFVLLVGSALVARALPGWPGGLADVRIHEWLLSGWIMAATIAALVLPMRLAAVLSLSASSYGIALVFLLFGAPDLALTQLLVETLIAVLIVLAFVNLPRLTRQSRRATVSRDLALALIVGTVVTMLTLNVLDTPFDGSVSDYFIRNSYTEAHGRNIVNVILVDFRAFDTLGEITVLALSGIGIYALLAPADRPVDGRVPDHPSETRKNVEASVE